MTSEGITKQEILAMIDVQAKSAAAMENIANSIRQLHESQKEIVELQQEALDRDTRERAECKEHVSCKFASTAYVPDPTIKAIDDIAKGVRFLKVVFTSLLGVIGIGMVVLELIHRK